MDHSAPEDTRRIPPYGPARGMLQGLQLLQRIDPPRVDETLLRAQQIAPNNEYKVIGALQFLGLIDEQGRPTEKSRLLKTRGGAFILNVQTILRQAYAQLFRDLDLKQASRDDIYNFFVVQYGLGSEMALKATRFFTQACRFAEIDLPNAQPSRAGPPARQPAQAPRRTAPRPRDGVAPPGPGFVVSPFLLLITPEVAALDEDNLTALFEKIGSALRRAGIAPDPAEAAKQTPARRGSHVDRD